MRSALTSTTDMNTQIGRYATSSREQGGLKWPVASLDSTRTNGQRVNLEQRHVLWFTATRTGRGRVEAAVDQATAACGGDVRSTIRANLPFFKKVARSHILRALSLRRYWRNFSRV
jgi:hypothetical protein